MSSLADFALHARSRDEYRQAVLGELLRTLNLEQGFIWHTDGRHSSLAPTPGLVADVLRPKFSEYMAEFSEAELTALTAPNTITDEQVFGRARQERLSIYSEFVHRYKFDGFIARAWMSRAAYHVVAFPKEGAARAIEQRKTDLDLLFPMLSIGEALSWQPDDDDLRTWATEQHVTRSEWEVAVLVRRGLTNPEIAGLLSKSPNTIRNHLASIFNKLGVSTRAELCFVLCNFEEVGLPCRISVVAELLRSRNT